MNEAAFKNITSEELFADFRFYKEFQMFLNMKTMVLIFLFLFLIGNPLRAECLSNEKIVDVSKTILPEKTNGDAIGIYKFSGKSLKVLINELDNLISNSVTKQLFTHAVKNILNKVDIFSVSTEGRSWIEIDDQNDLNMAQNLIKKILEN